MAEIKSFSASELAKHVGGRLIGEETIRIRRIADLASADVGEVAYVDDEKHLEVAKGSRASCLIVPTGFDIASAQSQTPRAYIETAKPKLAFALVAELLHPQKSREPTIHPTAVIPENVDIDLTVYIGPHVSLGEGVRIGAGTRIEAGVVIGDRVSIGLDCVLQPGVVVYDDVTIGNRVVLHAGVCIGADGFGYVRGEMSYHKFPQVGTVVIEDDVELGAKTCVDRAALGQTRIGRGTKIDNMVHVGHNCDIGERVIIAAQTGISGSVTIEDDVVIGGQVGFGDHIRVLSGAVIGSKAGILPGKIVRPGVWWGIPIQPLDDYKRMNAHMGRLSHMREEIKELRKELEELRRSDTD
ncbi:MAG TPA: UDP-3-O-(3-hydroxymyristoyl)glucosamine N-acyltransferase [Pyrinomonadaceae bacterium]|nr:UDP-3-O-(3-hydroxymyristoyl)glucosamine N-acyltransferase [Pyrinomonadaceae bacterium]